MICKNCITYPLCRNRLLEAANEYTNNNNVITKGRFMIAYMDSIEIKCTKIYDSMHKPFTKKHLVFKIREAFDITKKDIVII